MSSGCYMQRLMLRMVEWHARALHGWSYDTWFNGRFLEKWADPSVLEAMKSVFAHYDTKDIANALLASMCLFRRIGTDVASKLGLQFPEEADKSITNWVESCLRAM